jgi:formylglycine-generating enzyme
MMKQLTLTLILIVMAVYAFAAAPVVSNVVATPSAGQVTITYNLAADAECTVSLLVSANDGLSYDYIPSGISGAVGNSVSAGTGKSIIWYPSADGMAVGTTYKVKVIARDNPSPTAPDNFILVEGGTFSRQDNNGTYPVPEVMVTLSSFYIDKYEVTQAEYQAVMGTNPSSFAGNPSSPVEQVSWFKAIEYCNRRSMQEGLSPCYSYGTFGTNPNNWPSGWNTLAANHTNVSCNWTANGYRLPTEMEWMFAAKGGNQSQGYTYSGSSTLGNVAWYSTNNTNEGYPTGTKPVGLKLANELGTFDMSGNVSEWCWDIYGSTYPSGSQTNPTGASSGSNRVNRGGGWNNKGAGCMVSVRSQSGATTIGTNSGFRVVRGIHQEQVSAPGFDPPAGTYTSMQNVSITTSTSGAEIRYTTDGTEPNESSALYSTPISVSANVTLMAKAVFSGWIGSEIATAEYVINTMPANFVLVEGGTFHNGTSDVSLSTFYIDKYELTQAGYQAVMGTNPSSFAGNPNRPVERVSWFNAIEYCNRRSMQEGLSPCYSYGTFGTNPSNWPAGWNTEWQNHTNVSCNWTANGYRLPTEMEWMYAAKGGDQSQGYTYSGSNDINTVAWYSSNSDNRTWDAGSLASNELGTFDMTGNVWEWCWDIYGSTYPSGSQNNPTGASSGDSRVNRGGGWINIAAHCTVSHRGSTVATSGFNSIGFRCVRISP